MVCAPIIYWTKAESDINRPTQKENTRQETHIHYNYNNDIFCLFFVPCML